MKCWTAPAALLVLLSPLATAAEPSLKDARNLLLIDRDADAIHAVANSSIGPVEITVDIRPGSLITTQKSSLAETRTFVDLLALRQRIEEDADFNLAWNATQANVDLAMQTLAGIQPYLGKNRCGAQQNLTDLASRLTASACSAQDATLRCAAAKDRFDLALDEAQTCLSTR